MNNTINTVSLPKNQLMKKVSFAEYPAEKQLEANQDKKMSTGSKIILGGLAATAAVAIGIIALRKGKITTIDSFKKAGNYFEKGIAKNKNGSAFTGVLEHIKKDGTKMSLKYDNGKIVESFKDGNIFRKYEYNCLNDVDRIGNRITTFNHELNTASRVTVYNDRMFGIKNIEIGKKYKFDPKTLDLDIASGYDIKRIQTDNNPNSALYGNVKIFELSPTPGPTGNLYYEKTFDNIEKLKNS